jgi:serine/threonine-protein kinase
VIASGGFGIIHRSYDRRLRREVALKVSRTSSPADQQRLLLEAALTARLEHPGIIPIHDVGRLTGGRS